ncbi:MAG: protein-export chaperone SecB [Alphaproteobacteria bacterium]|nr:protein-export chaperone SecB [Alphaproteobacteria bacterium]
MSDTAATAQPNVGMPLQINAQYIKDLSFENPRAPASLQPQETQPQISVNVDVSATRLAENAEVFEVLLKITAKATVNDTVLFLTDLSYAGLFTLKEIPEDALHPMLLIECPRILFPFARAIVADTTRDGGFPPLLIQPVDFAAMYRQSQDPGS